MNDIIPSLFYKRAAQLMDVLPEIKFMDIVKVLYEHNRLSNMVEREEEMLNELPTGLKVENSIRKRAFHGRKPYNRRKRKFYREAVVDGKEYRATTLSALFSQLGFKDEYKERPHIMPSFYTKENIVSVEYEYLKTCLEKYGSKLDNYSAYDFDGQIKTVGETIKTSEACNA